jgi:predicted HAD superfamily phosphohydrolase YqeG
MTRTILAFALFFAASTAPALCVETMKAGHKMAMMNMTPEQREEMAKNHEKMAACLRSDKPMMDCHKEMMESCKMGKNACAMMGDMGHMHSMMGKGMKHDHSKMEQEDSDKDDVK